jgi:hypothetical protein
MAGEFVADVVFDAALDEIAGNAVRLAVCSSAPAAYANIAAATLASFTIDSSDFTKANGDTSGRKVTVGAQSGATASGTGTATHLVLHDNSSVMYAINACSSQAITTGNTVNTAAYDIEIRDAAAP